MQGQIPDRVPVVAWIDPQFLRTCLGQEDFDPVAETIRVSRSFGFDAIVRLVLEDAPTWQGSEWQLNTELVHRDGKQIRIKTIETPGGGLREVTVAREIEPGRFFHHTVEHLVKTQDDLRLMERYHIVRPPVNTTPLERALETIGDDGIVVVYGGGAAHTGAALYLRGLERLTIDSFENPALYQGLLNWAIEYEIGLLDTLQRFKPDLCQIGGLMAQGNFLGPDFYRQHVLDYDRRYIDQAHRRGLRTVYHNCGYSRNLLELYADLDTDAFESFPPPPVADGNMAHTKQVLGDRTSLMGNIDQVHLLRTGTLADIRRAVQKTVLAGKEGGRFILMTADELYHDTPAEALRVMVEVGRTHGRYN